MRGFRVQATEMQPSGVQPITATLKTVDWQKVRLQELMRSGAEPGAPQGAAARTIDVELFADCVSACKCGDTVTATGFVRVMAVDAPAATPGRAKSGVMLMYIEAESLQNHTAAAAGTRTTVRARAAPRLPAVRRAVCPPLSGAVYCPGCAPSAALRRALRKPS